MITMHGALYLAHRTEGDIQRRARTAAVIFGLVMLAGFSAAGAWIALGDFGYAITSVIETAAQPDPLAKTVVRQSGAWLANYAAAPATIVVPLLAYAGTALALLAVMRGRTLTAFVASSFALTGVIGTAGVSMFPFVMPSSTVPGASLTVWDAVSSQRTLGIMFWATLLFMPLIVAYTSWAYKVMAGKVTTAWIRENEHSAY
jgi:cytochrome d ubiquinol oxidase subunit II